VVIGEVQFLLVVGFGPLFSRLLWAGSGGWCSLGVFWLIRLAGQHFFFVALFVQFEEAGEDFVAEVVGYRLATVDFADSRRYPYSVCIDGSVTHC
jgi:hypothetical protein